jgi:hypothetical protein
MMTIWFTILYGTNHTPYGLFGPYGVWRMVRKPAHHCPKELGLDIYPIADLTLPQTNLYMSTAGMGKQALSHWTHFFISVAGIEREIWAFVRPVAGKRLSLLLGLPFLESVDAKLHIRNEIIELGDAARGETVVMLKTPQKFVYAIEVKHRRPSQRNNYRR